MSRPAIGGQVVCVIYLHGCQETCSVQWPPGDGRTLVMVVVVRDTGGWHGGEGGRPMRKYRAQFASTVNLNKSELGDKFSPGNWS